MAQLWRITKKLSNHNCFAIANQYCLGMHKQYGRLNSTMNIYLRYRHDISQEITEVEPRRVRVRNASAKQKEWTPEMAALRDDRNELWCTGCGAAIQHKKEDSPGFLPVEKFIEVEKDPNLASKIVCRRCFQLKNYGANRTTPIKVSLAEYTDHLQQLRSKNAVVRIALPPFFFLVE